MSRSVVERLLAGLRVDPDRPAVMTTTIEWTPGDPIYSRPNGVDWDEQVIRPLFSVLDDYIGLAAYLTHCTGYCARCEVYEQSRDTCWICGNPTPGRRTS